jgi:hypothetical protein
MESNLSSRSQAGIFHDVTFIENRNNTKPLAFLRCDLRENVHFDTHTRMG